uniref:Uncharacterized protein n=1 Tax=Candidatus Kentrum sp. FM TaxID=2126340 RepID=A0A450TLB0_9GAMM|nr:MAG: hypothetical protein BECKFM1743A_GA0114220_104735 [Candidatus Kentron sp. FM]VFJ68738.1 MAG: hypothetical protein BECKFM1743C_GA0114222_104974 [Candidatus Kentron sp. FM]VFK17095.1 MAG: hypothetical protein BECKFM1743B_GA0114221_104594 [Candidatus Kentron sp. FM]
MHTDYSQIKPNHFFSSEKEKTNFNWFAFEFACELDMAVSFSLKKRLSKKGYTKEMFNLSCIKLSKLLQGVVLDTLNNKIPAMELNHTEIEAAFPKLDDKTIDRLLTCTEKAWAKLLDTCVLCPQACVSNKDEYCVMFDDPYYS